MLEMSAAKSPALALPGAVLAAVPATMSADGAQIADFSVLLAGATLAGEAPALMTDMLVQPEADTPPAPEFLPLPATLPSKGGTPGNVTGKNLPVGKLPATRMAAIADKTPRKLRSEDAELTNEGTAARPEQDAVVPAESMEKASVQTSVAAPALAEPSTESITPAPQTASNIVLAAPAQDTIVPPTTDHETAAKQQRTPTKLQSRTQAKIQPQVGTAKATGVAARSAAAKLQGAPVAEASTASDHGRAVSSEPVPPRDATGPADSAASRAVLDATAIIEAAAPRIQGAVNQPSSVSAAPAPMSRATVAQPTIAPAAITPETGTPATMTQFRTAVVTTPAPIVDVAQLAPTTVETQSSSLPRDVEPVATPRATAPLARATITTLLAQTAPSALIQAAASSLAAALPTVEPVAEVPAASAQVATPALALAMPSAEVAATPSKAAMATATLPDVKSAPANAPASPSAVAPTVTPTTLAQATLAAPVAAPATRQAPETSTIASPVKLAQAPATASAPTIATPRSAPEPTTTVSPAQVAQDRSPALAAAAQPARIEAVMIAPVLAGSEKDRKAAATISPVTATEAPLPLARPQMDASTLAAEFRSAPSSAAPTTPAAPAPSAPTQDIAALVDRISEARAAASPHTIRASLVHEDFGAVSVNLRSEASHIHVTLGSADPGFAPAVQAAAAANVAGNTGDDAQNRRDAPVPQSSPQPQDGTRNDASSQQQQAQRERANADERQPSRQASGRQPVNSGERASTSPATQRRSGIYA